MSTPPSPRVSVIVRTKDRPRLLSRALDDILAQDFVDWEAVIVNDGGEDTVVDKLLRAHPGFGDRVRVLHHAASLGMETASNRGMAETTGEFVVVHDDDDTWATDFLSAAVGWLDEHPDALAVSMGTEIVRERLESDGIVELGREPFGPPHDIVTAYDLLLSNRFVPISVLIRRAALESLGGFDETLPVVGDWELNLRLALHGEVGYVAEPIRAFWHQRPDAQGDLSNSVHGAKELHHRYDRLVRDRELRAHVAQYGVGGLLYLTKFIDERIAASERHTYEKVRDSIEAQQDEIRRLRVELAEAIRHHSFGATVRRVMGRFLRRK